MLKIGVIDFNYDKVDLLLEKTLLKSKKYQIILLILVCFTWTPKAVYHEDISSLPLYRTIVKTKYFIGNFKNFSDNSL